MSLLDTASLIVTPNGYKEGKLYSVIPSDGSGDMSVVRATTATRVNSAGLVELVPYNLLGYSQDFTNAYWNKNNGNGGTLPIVTANYATNPFGASNASRIQLQRTSTSGSYSQVFTAVTLQNATQYTWSVWLKSLSGTPTITIAYNGASYSTITLTNEWVRYELPLTTNGSYFEANFGTYQSEASTSLTADFLAWGFQLVEGSTAKDYQKTETRLNIPRLDYSNGTCPSLLVEPQRTNLVTYSSSFDNAVWTKINVTTTTNATNSPSGVQDGNSILEVATTGTHESWNRVSMTSGQPYTQSCFFKANGRNRVIMQIFDNATQYGNGIFDLNTGVVVASSGGATIQEYENGWYRCTITGTSPATGLGYCVIGLCEDTYNVPSVMPTYAGNASKGVYAWGFQTELGSYPTSYIPTTSASVTRNADVISKTGISSLIGQTEGTIFWEGQLTNLDSFSSYFGVTSGAFTNAVLVGKEAGVTPNKLFFFIRANGSDILFNTSNALTSDYIKMAIAYKSGDWAAYLNGTLVASGTSTFSFSSNLSLLVMGANNGGASIVADTSNHKAAVLWKTRLDNDTLEVLTGTGFTTYADMANYYNYTIQ